MERARILDLKENGAEEPWTLDPILQDGKFGNVWREADRGTAWELAQIAALERDRESQLGLVLTYRHNLIPWVTISLGAGATPEELVAEARGRAIMHDCIKMWPRMEVESGGVVRHAAPSVLADASPLDWARYVHAHHQDVKAAIPWLMWMAEHGRAGMDPGMLLRGLEAWMPRLGPFKAYEVATSLTYLRWWPMAEASLVHVGHGALPALQHLVWGDDDDDSDGDFPSYPFGGLDDPRWGDLMVEASWAVAGHLRSFLDMRWYHAPELAWQRPLYPGGKFTPRTMEDCLCEYRKYRAVAAGERENRPRADVLGRWS